MKLSNVEDMRLRLEQDKADYEEGKIRSYLDRIGEKVYEALYRGLSEVTISSDDEFYTNPELKNRVEALGYKVTISQEETQKFFGCYEVYYDFKITWRDK